MALLSGCQKKSVDKLSLQTFRPPSASETFELQSKCVALGVKVVEENTIGPALTHDQVSHYNPKDNRCYVLLRVSTADLSTPLAEYIDDNSLYDGQTRELLASRNCKARVCGALLFDDSLKSIVSNPDEHNGDEVRDVMDKFMHVDRRF